VPSLLRWKGRGGEGKGKNDSCVSAIVSKTLSFLRESRDKQKMRGGEEQGEP